MACASRRPEQGADAGGCQSKEGPWSVLDQVALDLFLTSRKRCPCLTISGYSPYYSKSYLEHSKSVPSHFLPEVLPKPSPCIFARRFPRLPFSPSEGNTEQPPCLGEVSRVSPGSSEGLAGVDLVTPVTLKSLGRSQHT